MKNNLTWGKILSEAAGPDGKILYEVKIIAVGQGSSGFYAADVLETYGASAFPAGTHFFVNHKSDSERPERDVRNLVGALTEAAHFDADHAEGPGLYGAVEFTTEGLALVREVKDFIGLSINAQGKIREADDGTSVVESLEPSPLNSVDLVTRAGAGGKILGLMESYGTSGRIVETNVAPFGATIETERKDMLTDEDLTKIVAGITEALAASNAALVEALRPVAPKVEDQTPDLAAATEAAVDANLPKVARDKVRNAVAAGKTIEEAVRTEVEYRDELLTEAQKPASFKGVLESDRSNTESFTVGGWK